VDNADTRLVGAGIFAYSIFEKLLFETAPLFFEIIFINFRSLFGGDKKERE